MYLILKFSKCKFFSHPIFKSLGNKHAYYKNSKAKLLYILKSWKTTKERRVTSSITIVII